MKLFKQLKWYFNKEWKRYLGSIILLIIVAILQLIPPKIVGIIVDLIERKKIIEKKILMWIIIMLITSILIYFFRYLWRILLFGASYNLAIELRKKFYCHISKQPPEFYLKHRTGDLMARATNDIDRVVFAAGEGVLTLVDSLVMGILVLIIMSTQISFILTIISLVPMPIMAIFIKKYGEMLHISFRKSQAAFSELNNQTQESLSCIRMIKSFGLEKQELSKFLKFASNAGKKNMKVAKIDAKFDPTIYLSIAFSNLLAVIQGGYLVWNNRITIGQLTSFIMYLGLMIWPMLAIAWMFNIVQRGSAALDRINLIFKENNSIKNAKQKKISKNKILKIKINKFYYKNHKNFFLKSINIKLIPGNILGICGPTGSGKSTIIGLIQRHFSINKGNIFYDNISILDFNISEWRKKLAIVNQSSFLFSDTILNNISLGKPNISYEKIEKITRIVNLHNEITKLPKGYNTEIGDRGIVLSGGQKQRIAIARALLLKREILILDDSLSAIDNYTSKKILKNLFLNKNRYFNTMIIITHRLNILIKSNEIIVINNGKITERGNHKTLISKTNWYQNIYSYQKNNKNYI
ncbi:SmdA family multidrug ABC transporter permease/ATP-binding protein [Buchnera aphidicola (Neophyllaphis podocarpi)]|uniref:SmdA family multidrug ABC transporter permease/ATP-binding protein n=1 Tax=Buchnera aphidicola TaxID=9 RepID=UPI0031B8A558